MHIDRKIGTLKLMITKKIAGSVTGEKITFEGESITNVTSNKETLN